MDVIRESVNSVYHSRAHSVEQYQWWFKVILLLTTFNCELFFPLSDVWWCSWWWTRAVQTDIDCRN